MNLERERERKEKTNSVRKNLSAEDHPVEWLLKNLDPSIYEAIFTWLLEFDSGFPDPRDFQLPVAKLYDV